jgi:2-keto-4-pentenoate hydratase/2-oxohepta-3-ene-1,7-dioic acid hydratase in catechol pathway
MRAQWDLPGADIDVGTLYCIGRNYAAHAAEMGSAVPDEPLVFIKPPTSYRPSGSTIHLPAWTSNVHHEVEVVVVIGDDLDAISANDALSAVAGVGIGLDLTARDVQAEAKKRGEPWSRSKGWKGAAPVSGLVPGAECLVPGADPLTFDLLVNGDVRQQGSTALMERSIASLICFVADVFGLRRGDAIFTGTPEGVAALHSGDHVEARLHDLATLTVNIA